MKKLTLLISLLLLLPLGCQNDDFVSELDGNMVSDKNETLTPKESNTLLSDEKMVPLKGVIIEIGEGQPLDCFGMPYFATYLDVKGQVTHLGNVAGGYANLYCHEEIEIRNGIPFIVVSVDGQFKDANGDVLNYIGELLIQLDNGMPIMTNWFSITGGSGRWDGAGGHFTAMFEPLEDGTLKYTVNGWVTPPGKINNV